MAKHKQAGDSKRRSLSENWKTIILQGVVAVGIGIVIVAVPDLSAKVVSILLGALLIVYAILSIVSGVSARKEEEPSVWLFARGGIAAAGGLVILFWPSMKDLGLLYILGVFAITAGVIVGVLGLFQKWDTVYKGISGLGGMAAIIFGVVLISYSNSLADSIVWIVGIFAIAFGLLLIVLGMGARGVAKEQKPS